MKSQTDNTNRSNWVRIAITVFILLEQASGFVCAEELSGKVTDTEFTQSDTGVSEPTQNQHKAPAWFGAADMAKPAKEPDNQKTSEQASNGNQATSGDKDIKPQKDTQLNGQITSQNANDNSTTIVLQDDFKGFEARFGLLINTPPKEFIGHAKSDRQTKNDSERYTANAESDWQNKYWDSWWRRFDRAARLKIWFWQKIRGVEWGNVNLTVRVSKAGNVDVDVQRYENSEWADIVANAYRHLAYTKTVQFPQWSQRSSVEEDRNIFVTHGIPKWSYKTGDYETVSASK